MEEKHYLAVALYGDKGCVDMQRFEFGKQDTLIHLSNKIQDVWSMKKEFQSIEFDGKRLLDPATKLESFSFDEKNPIIVKHSLLENWKTYLAGIEQIENAKSSIATSRKQQIFTGADEMIPPLVASSFFTTYPALLVQRWAIENKIGYLVHNTSKYLKLAVEKYFSSVFKSHKVDLVDKPKNKEGVQLGVFVYVKNTSGKVVSSYYAKTLGEMPRAGIAPDEKPAVDLGELFVYELFRLTGIGATEVHIIPDELKSGCVYLATTLIDNFHTASGCSVDHILGRATSRAVPIGISSDQEKQLDTLASLLCLTDLKENKGNYGIAERQPTGEELDHDTKDPIKELRIVDFRVNMTRTPLISNLDTNIQYLKDYFSKLQITENMDKAKRSIEENPSIKKLEEAQTAQTNKPAFDAYFSNIQSSLEEFLEGRKKARGEE